MEALKEKTAKILGVKNVKDWKISDFKEFEDGSYLVQVHFLQDEKNREKKTKFPRLRGVVVEIDDNSIDGGRIIAHAYPKTPSVVCDKLRISHNGNLIIKAPTRTEDLIQKKVIEIPEGKFKLRHGFDGFLLKVFKYKGIVYFSSNKKLDASMSFWGDSDYFKDIYLRNGGPTESELFPEDCTDSPFVYVFMVVDKVFLVGTRQDVGTGYVALLDVKKIENDFESDGDYRKYDEREEPSQFKVVSTVPSKIEEPFVYFSDYLTVEQANDHLESGFFEKSNPSDIRLGTGEFVVVYVYDDNDQISKVIRVQSSAYDWRLNTLLEHNRNPRHQFFVLATLAKFKITGSSDNGKENYKRFKERFVLYKVEGVTKEILKDAIKSGGFIPDIGKTRSTIKDLEDYNVRLKVIWLNFIISLPPQRQLDAIEYLREYLDAKKKIVKTLLEIYEAKKKRDYVEAEKEVSYTIGSKTKTKVETYNKRIYAMVKELEKSVKENEKSGSESPSSIVLKNTAKKITSKEWGISIYKLNKNIDIMTGEYKPILKIRGELRDS